MIKDLSFYALADNAALIGFYMAGLLLAPRAPSASCPFQVNDEVERVIDNVWFCAKVTAVDEEIEEVCLLYLDDENKEDGVSFDEIRPHSSTWSPPLTEAAASLAATGIQQLPESKKAQRETLQKPLAGLIEDDWEDRLNHVATAVVHKSADTEEAIILNGAENELAAGGGLRALRFIRKKGT